MTTRYMIYELQLQDPDRGIPIIAAGGKFTVTTAGSAAKATLYDPDSFASLANPITPVRGKLRFATLDTVASVDLYGFAPGGQFVVLRGAKPGQLPEIMVDLAKVHQTAVIPLYAGDYTAATEGTTGLAFPTGGLILPYPSLKVITAQSGKTIEVGLLSSETGGDADGLIDAASIATAGAVGLLNTGTATQGLLIQSTFATTPAVYFPKSYALAAALTVSVTFSSGSTTADVLALVPYHLPPV